MVHAAGPRRSLAHPTLFNLLGPLTNPAGATRQLIGVYDASSLPIVGETLHRLGAERAVVAHGDDGLDEITTTATSRLTMVEPHGMSAQTVDPEQFGLASTTLDRLRAASVEDAARIVRGVLAGDTGPPRDIAALNAAAAALASGVTDSLEDGLEMAFDAIDSGAALTALDKLARASAGRIE
jgi:anthranilate phosphoribosyltransferase